MKIEKSIVNALLTVRLLSNIRFKIRVAESESFFRLLELESGYAK